MADQTLNQFTKGNAVEGMMHTFKANGAILLHQIVELDTASGYPYCKVHTTTQTVGVLGVAMADAADGEECVIACPGAGIHKVISGAAGMTIGGLVVPSSVTAGACATVTRADGTTLYGALGIALETADELNELVPVLMLGLGIVANA